jgi:hypothetical protein
MSNAETQVRTVLVCLPAHSNLRFAVELASTKLAMRGVSACGAMPHFTPCASRGLRGVRRSRQLLDVWRGTAAGGPIRLLDLEAMRLRSQAQAATQWLIWQQATAGTRAAQPFWEFVQRHRDNPKTYPLAQAQHHYRTQPRVQAMTAFNALPNRPCDLPTSSLEAFQAGQVTFATLAYLTAVPADGLATASLSAHEGWLTPASGQLEDQLAYLKQANAYLAGLHPDTTLVAMATTD